MENTSQSSSSSSSLRSIRSFFSTNQQEKFEEVDEMESNVVSLMQSDRNLESDDSHSLPDSDMNGLDAQTSYQESSKAFKITPILESSMDDLINSSKMLTKFAEYLKEFDRFDLEGKSIDELQLLLSDLIDINESSLKILAKVLYNQLQKYQE